MTNKMLVLIGFYLRLTKFHMCASRGDCCNDKAHSQYHNNKKVDESAGIQGQSGGVKGRGQV